MYSRGECGRALKFRNGWEGLSGKCCCCQPDSGNPTVRDERGAYGNVGYGGNRNPSHIPKGCVSETLCLRLRAPYFYPTTGAFTRKFDSGSKSSIFGNLKCSHKIVNHAPHFLPDLTTSKNQESPFRLRWPIPWGCSLYV